jgi:integrase
MGYIMAQIEFKYLHRTKNRHGKYYYSFRKKGHKRMAIPGVPGSAEFVAAYESALGLSISEKKIKPGSVSALVSLFYGSTKFAGLAKHSTQRTYRHVLDSFCYEHGDKPVVLLEMHHIEKIIAAKASTPAAANQLLKRLRQVLDVGVKHGWIKINPAKGIEKIRYIAKPIHTWTEEQVAQFVKRHPPGTMAYLGFVIMSCTGVRRSDLIKLGKPNIRGDRLVVESIEKNNELLNVPLHPLLLSELSSVKDRFIFMVTGYGVPFASSASFGNWFRDRCNEAGLKECSAHGLRKLIATRLAEAGASENSISAILAWRDNRQASHYTKAANKGKLADLGMKQLTAGGT